MSVNTGIAKTVSCNSQSLLQLKNQKTTLKDKTQDFKSFFRQCQQHKKMAYGALGELYFQANKPKKAIYYFNKMEQANGQKPLYYNIKKAEYAASLFLKHKQLGKVNKIFSSLETELNQPLNLILPPKVAEIYKQYLLKSQKFKTSEELAGEIVSTRSTKNFGVRPVIPVVIHFEYDSAQIKPESQSQINEIYKTMNKKGFKGLSYLFIGHTDLKGTATYNMGLSRRRAAAVKNALVQKSAQLNQQIQTTGKGESQPLFKEESTDANKINRRVEIKVLN